MSESSAEELRAIEELHEKDAHASLTGDFETLRSLMTDDAVVISPLGGVTRGAVELDASFKRMRKAMAEIDVLEYRFEIEEVKILGDFAFEWGAIQGAMREKGSDKVVKSTHRMMRILQKQPDGSWRVHRSIWNGE